MLELKSISDMRFNVNGLVGLLNKLTVKKSLAENFVNINSFLPDEVLEKIFFLLPHQDLKVVLRVTWLGITKGVPKNPYLLGSCERCLVAQMEKVSSFNWLQNLSLKLPSNIVCALSKTSGELQLLSRVTLWLSYPFQQWHDLSSHFKKRFF